jgi:hypothetical protein
MVDPGRGMGKRSSAGRRVVPDDALDERHAAAAVDLATERRHTGGGPGILREPVARGSGVLIAGASQGYV